MIFLLVFASENKKSSTFDACYLRLLLHQ